MKKFVSLCCLLLLLLSFTVSSLPVEAYIADMSLYANDLYEPETSVVLPATIAWPSDSDASSKAVGEKRPNTVFVRINEKLQVSSMNGFPLEHSLVNYLKKTKAQSLTALYIDNQATANALIEFIQNNNLKDAFVVASYENIDLIKEVASKSTAVYGIVDFTEAKLTEDDMAEVISLTHAADARIALIPESCATRETIDYLRGRLTSVWVQCKANEKSIYTQLTNGANGIYCEDYEKVIEALESFPENRTILRPSFIAGHRGMPSQYIENTIRSAQAAVDAGADVIECDIHLSKDGELFLLHDFNLKRLFNQPQAPEVSQLTLEELQAFTYDMTDKSKEEAPNSVLNSNNENRTKEGREYLEIAYDPEYDYIPSLRDYFEVFKDQDVLHFVEIKTNNTDVVAALKALAEEIGVEEQMVCISFNAGFGGNPVGYNPEIDVLREIHNNWSALPQGYLGYDNYVFSDHAAIIERDGHAANACGKLLDALEPYNATYNPYYKAMSYETVSYGRHRGITVWPWTYNNELDFAKAYLDCIYGITTNYAFWASEYPKQIVVEDQKLEDGNDIVFEILNQKGEPAKYPVELIQLSGTPISMSEDYKLEAEEAGEALVMLKLVTEIEVDGTDLSEIEDTSYALYSKAFTITIPEKEAGK